jgi:hypothetical protein
LQPQKALTLLDVIPRMRGFDRSPSITSFQGLSVRTFENIENNTAPQSNIIMATRDYLRLKVADADGKLLLTPMALLIYPNCGRNIGRSYDINDISQGVASLKVQDQSDNNQNLGTAFNNKRQNRSWIIENIVLPSIQSAPDLDFITVDHECFVIAEEFRKRWERWITDYAWYNFVLLLCGCRQFPLLLLQNPTKTHNKVYEEMIKCPTIDWINEAFESIGLMPNVVPVLDICSFFSNEELRLMDEETELCAIKEAFELTERIIKILRPSVIISCQCWSWRYSESNMLPWLLSSSEKATCNSEAFLVRLGEEDIWVVNGFHPMTLKYRNDENLEKVLKALFRDMYTPYVSMHDSLTFLFKLLAVEMRQFSEVLATFNLNLRRLANALQDEKLGSNC